MKQFCFTVDDNIRCLCDLTSKSYESIFSNPYLAMYRRLYERFSLKVQLNLFYETDGFNLSQMTDRYKAQWRANADWLKLSFHARAELPRRPYEKSDYDEVYADCAAVHKEILRFASEESLAKTTTLHFCTATEAGVSALSDLGVYGLLGLYGTDAAPRVSYQNTSEEGASLRRGETVFRDGMHYAGIDLVLNALEREAILSHLAALTAQRGLIKVMIHEQYFYPDYERYQSDFEEKLAAAFALLKDRGFESRFLEETLKKNAK